MARGALVSMVFSKTLTVSAHVNAGKGSNTLTLMSTDVGRISRGLDGLHEIWASPIEVGIAVWLLERQMGAACIVPSIIALGKHTQSSSFVDNKTIATNLHLASTFSVIRLTKLIGPAQVAWNKGVQQRLNLTSSILGNMKEVKLLGLSDRWSKEIQALRVRELELSKKSRTLSSERLTLSQSSPSARVQLLTRNE
jgi:ATP-binding cassette subfamily C (CFTR/MRP) protein 1